MTISITYQVDAPIAQLAGTRPGVAAYVKRNVRVPVAPVVGDYVAIRGDGGYEPHSMDDKGNVAQTRRRTALVGGMQVGWRWFPAHDDLVVGLAPLEEDDDWGLLMQMLLQAGFEIVPYRDEVEVEVDD